MLKLVIIDNDWQSLNNMFNFLSKNLKGYKIFATYTESYAALTHLHQHYVDAVILNADMPNIDGLEIMRICQREANPAKFIMISNELSFEGISEAIKLGVYDYLKKPVNPAELHSSLNRLYQDLKMAEPLTKFSVDDVLAERDIMFSDLLAGRIKNPVDLSVRMRQAGLEDNYMNKECALLNVHINSFSRWLTMCWDGGVGKFYKAFSRVFSKNTDKFDYLCTRTFYSNIELLVINKSQTPINQVLTDFIPEIPRTILEVFGIYCEVHISKIFSSFSEVIRYNIQEPVKLEIKSEEIVENAVKFIRHNYFRDITLEDVSNYVMLSREYFCTYYKQKTGENFIDSLNKHRVENAKKLLINTALTVGHIAESVGYRSVSHFHKTFKQFCGMSPAEYRKKNVTKE